MKIFRQGDVLLVQVQSLPQEIAEESPRSDGKIILAYGEVTGHHHRIETDVSHTSAKLWSSQIERFLQVMERTALLHEEHAAIPLEPGIYQIAIQTEYVRRAFRHVAD